MRKDHRHWFGLPVYHVVLKEPLSALVLSGRAKHTQHDNSTIRCRRSVCKVEQRVSFHFFNVLRISIDHMEIGALAISLFRVCPQVCLLDFSKFPFLWPLFTHNAVFVHVDFTPEFTSLCSGILTKVNQEPWVAFLFFFLGPNTRLHNIFHHSTNCFVYVLSLLSWLLMSMLLLLPIYSLAFSFLFVQHTIAGARFWTTTFISDEESSFAVSGR